MKFRLFLLLLITMFPALNAATLRCVQCNKVIRGRYFTSGGKAYCSETCIEKTWPKCSLCGKHFRNGVQLSDDPGKVFCSDCAAKPQCFSCRLPADCEKLDDGRTLCRECYQRAVFKYEEALEIFNEVRSRLKQELELGTEHRIHFQLVSLPELERRSRETGSGAGIELGLFYHNFTEVTRTTESVLPWHKPKTEVIRTNERFAIYVLYGMPREKLIEICAHELAHDWMQAKYPAIINLKIKEGWAEYVASKANRLFGNESLNRRIELNLDPIYGNGYREIVKYVTDHGKSGLYDYFASLNQNHSAAGQRVK